MLTERWADPPPGANEAEAKWWQEYADVEEQYCWAQPVWVQRRIRWYVALITGFLGPHGSVLEIGCGTGWLCLLLAEGGIKRVVGVDASPEQIRRANLAASDRGFAERISFVLHTDGLASLPEALGVRFDAVLLHGVLHHLTVNEARELLDCCSHRLLATRGRAVIVEPILCQAVPPRWVEWLVDRLIHAPMRGERWGLRTVSEQERLVRSRIEERNVGVGPRGPSPKEMPFVPGELEDLIEPDFTIQAKRPVFAFSVHAAKMCLLAGLTYPRLLKRLGPRYLGVVSAIERYLLARYTLPAHLIEIECIAKNSTRSVV